MAEVENARIEAIERSIREMIPPPANVVSIVSERNAMVLVIHVTSLWDEQGVDAVMRAFNSVLPQKPESIILDLGKVRYMASATLGVMIQMNKSSRTEGIQFAIRNVEPRLLELFMASRLDKIFTILPSQPREGQ